MLNLKFLKVDNTKNLEFEILIKRIRFTFFRFFRLNFFEEREREREYGLRNLFTDEFRLAKSVKNVI